MPKELFRTLAVCLVLLVLITPAAFASSPTGTDPEPGLVHMILTFLGLA
jgi:hypothetical protein